MPGRSRQAIGIMAGLGIATICFVLARDESSPVAVASTQSSVASIRRDMPRGHDAASEVPRPNPNRRHVPSVSANRRSRPARVEADRSPRRDRDDPSDEVEPIIELGPPDKGQKPRPRNPPTEEEHADFREQLVSYQISFHDEEMRRIEDRLQLDPAARKRLESVFRGHAEQIVLLLRPLPDDPRSRPELRKAMTTARVQFANEAFELLTPEQFQTYTHTMAALGIFGPQTVDYDRRHLDPSRERDSARPKPE